VRRPSFCREHCHRIFLQPEEALTRETIRRLYGVEPAIIFHEIERPGIARQSFGLAQGEYDYVIREHKHVN
jgi:hypothetical protein